MDGYILGSEQASNRLGQKPGFSNGVCLLGTVQEFTAGHLFRTVDLPSFSYTSTQGTFTAFSWDPCSYQVARITLTPRNNVTPFALLLGSSEPVNGTSALKDGATSVMIIKQDSVGGRTMVFDSRIKFPNNVVPTITAAPNAVTVMSCLCGGDSILYASLNFGYLP